jgi:glyoxylase-like metal-dependent hydrolase (beta-lactamase superfamily II)
MLIRTISNTQENFKLKYILLTHGHFNHVRYLAEIKRNLNGEIYIHYDDLSLLKELGIELKDVSQIRGFDKFKVGSIEIIAYHTPGHTEGSVCYYSSHLNALFSGDTLLRGSFGKIRGPHSMGKMLRSLKTISRMFPPETVVYPGHGSETRLKDEGWLDGLDMLS